MNMESFESSEDVIKRHIEDLATKEEMDSEDIFSDIITFSELYETDENAGAYFVVLAEKIGISFGEMLEFAKKLREE